MSNNALDLPHLFFRKEMWGEIRAFFCGGYGFNYARTRLYNWEFNPDLPYEGEVQREIAAAVFAHGMQFVYPRKLGNRYALVTMGAGKE